MMKTLNCQDRKKSRESEGREREKIFSKKIHERLWLLGGVLLKSAVGNVNAVEKLLRKCQIWDLAVKGNRWHKRN
jgi:hypothetical protein